MGARKDLTGLVALILAGGVAVALVVLAVAAGITEASKHLTLTSEASTLLSTTLGAAVGAVAVYLGGSRASSGGGGRAEPPPSEQPTAEWPQAKGDR